MEENKNQILTIINTDEKKYINEEGNIIIEKFIYIKEKKKPLNQEQKEAQKEAQKRYYLKNKEKINEYIKQNKKDRYNNDEIYRQYILSSKKEAYKKRKELKEKNTDFLESIAI